MRRGTREKGHVLGQRPFGLRFVYGFSLSLEYPITLRSYGTPSSSQMMATYAQVSVADIELKTACEGSYFERIRTSSYA